MLIILMILNCNGIQETHDLNPELFLYSLGDPEDYLLHNAPTACLLTSSDVSYLIIFRGEQTQFLQGLGTLFIEGDQPGSVTPPFHWKRLEFIVEKGKPFSLFPRTSDYIHIYTRNLNTSETLDIVKTAPSALLNTAVDGFNIYPLSYAGPLFSFLIEYWKFTEGEMQTEILNQIKNFNRQTSSLYNKQELDLSNAFIEQAAKNMVYAATQIDPSTLSISFEELLLEEGYQLDFDQYTLRFLDNNIYLHLRLPGAIPGTRGTYWAIEKELPFTPEPLQDYYDYYHSDKVYPKGMDRYSISPWTNHWIGIKEGYILAGKTNQSHVPSLIKIPTYFETNIISIQWINPTMWENNIHSAIGSFRECHPLLSLDADIYPEIDGQGWEWINIPQVVLDHPWNILNGDAYWSDKNDLNATVKSFMRYETLFLLVTIDDDRYFISDSLEKRMGKDHIELVLRLSGEFGIMELGCITIALIPNKNGTDIQEIIMEKNLPKIQGIREERIITQLMENLNASILKDNQSYTIELSLDTRLERDLNICGLITTIWDFDDPNNEAHYTLLSTSPYNSHILESIPLLMSEGQQSGTMDYAQYEPLSD